MAETARPFDTVYMSLYKYFNAASGAILAGPRELLDGMYPLRRMFGGGLVQRLAVCGSGAEHLEGFGDRFGRAVSISEDLIRGLGGDDRFKIERIPAGTNLFRLRVRGVDAASFRKRLAARGVMLSSPQGDAFLVGVNETLNRTTAARLLEAFVAAAA